MQRRSLTVDVNTAVWERSIMCVMWIWPFETIITGLEIDPQNICYAAMIKPINNVFNL